MQLKLLNHLKKKIILLIDDEDYEKIKDWKIQIDRYVVISKKEGPLLYKATLHRYIMKCPKDLIVDHINRNPYDNRKENLRITTPSGNSRNKSKAKSLKGKNVYSKYFGVTYDKHNKKWKASVREVYLGKYENEIDAAIAYDTYVKNINDSFRPLNFPNNKKEIIYNRKNLKRKYYGVVPERDKWRVSFMFKGKKYTAGKCFENVIDAAKEYNKIVIENKFDKKLNQILETT
jgi:hypothetical protein